MSSDYKKQTVKSTLSVSDFKKMFKTFFYYVHHRGFYSGIALAFNSFREWLWFASHRKSSVNLMKLNVIEKDLKNKTHSTFYVPTPIIPFLKLIRKINLPKHSVFVDYGAGKGRAMILAKECGFYKVKGLEFSLSLYKMAQKNIKSYTKKNEDTHFELIHIDVSSYQVKTEDNFFYFFHPFNEHILRQCLSNIYTSFKKKPRKAFLIYQSNYMDNTQCITKGGFFQLLKIFTSFGTRFYIYEYNP